MAQKLSLPWSFQFLISNGHDRPNFWATHTKWKNILFFVDEQMMLLPFSYISTQLGVFLECKTFMHNPYLRPTTATLGQNIAQKTPHSKLFWLQYISWLSAVSTLHTDHKGFNTVHKLNPVITFQKKSPESSTKNEEWLLGNLISPIFQAQSQNQNDQSI